MQNKPTGDANKPREAETMVTEVLFGIESFKYRTNTKHLGVFVAGWNINAMLKTTQATS